ncbi:MAG: molybdenum cofactor biosynthesis protein MoaE [Thermodesulfobacteriota bacterium]|nr:molybdenum cofactor biosynthesis protein MoaE [Thermodesulfobacteriota bacterium]
MNIEAMIQKVKEHPDYGKVGMILCHNGVVRQTTREGEEVTGLKVTVDHEKLNRLIIRQKEKKGIIEIFVEIADNQRLKVGDDIMQIVVAGDIRDNVIETLSETLNKVKAGLTSKEHFFN